MLEKIALQYVNQSEDGLRLIGYGIFIVGAVLAGLTNKHRNELARAPYFAHHIAKHNPERYPFVIWLDIYYFLFVYRNHLF